MNRTADRDLPVRPTRWAHAAVATDGAAILDSRRGRWFLLPPAGALVWRHVANGAPPAAIAAEISATYGIGVTQARADVDRLLDQLLADRLIVRRQRGLLPVARRWKR